MFSLPEHKSKKYHLCVSIFLLNFMLPDDLHSFADNPEPGFLKVPFCWVRLCEKNFYFYRF